MIVGNTRGAMESPQTASDGLLLNLAAVLLQMFDGYEPVCNIVNMHRHTHVQYQRNNSCNHHMHIIGVSRFSQWPQKCT